jgi:hypothetical protein
MAETPAKSKNWLLVKFRQYHTWLGVGLSLFIIVICLTGIYLNHKPLFNSLFGKQEKEHHEEKDKRPRDKKPGDKTKAPKLAAATPATNLVLSANPSLAVSLVAASPEQEQQPLRQTLELHTSTSLKSYPVDFERALHLARQHWQDDQLALERIELRTEEGTMVYKIKDLDEREVIINAESGALTEKKPHHDWGKTLKDLHTGKIGGTFGKLLVDFTSIVMLFLTGSGIYLWLAPLLRKRNKAEKAGESSTAKPSAVSSKSSELLEKLRAKKAAAAEVKPSAV